MARQTDPQRRLFWESFAARYPALRLRWGNTFSRWRDVAGTELVVAHYITDHSVGIFVRGQRGMPVPETAARLYAFSLGLALGAELGDPRCPFLRQLRADTLDPETWPECHDWLFAAGDAYAVTLTEIVGGAG
jgi:hypothetical protein